MDDLSGLPGKAHRDRTWPSVLGYGIVLGVISGGLIAAAGAYRVLLCESGATLIFGALALVAWAVAGFRVGRRTGSPGAAALAGLLAGIVGAWGGLAISWWLVNQHASELAACLTRTGNPMSVDDVLASEPRGMLLMAVVLPIIAAALGFLAGVLGTGGKGKVERGAFSPEAVTPDDMRGQADRYIADAARAPFHYGGLGDRVTARKEDGTPGPTEPRDLAP